MITLSTAAPLEMEIIGAIANGTFEFFPLPYFSSQTQVLFLRYSTTMHCLVTPGTIRYGFGNANDQRRIRRFFPIEKCFTPIDQKDIV